MGTSTLSFWILLLIKRLFFCAPEIIDMGSKAIAAFALVPLLIITAFDNVNAQLITRKTPTPPAPETAGTSEGTHGTGSTISGVTGDPNGDPLDNCYRNLNYQQAINDHCNMTMAKDILNVDDCYQSLSMCDQWLNECSAGNVHTMPPPGHTTPHHKMKRQLEYDFQLHECEHELRVLMMKNRVCYHQVSRERVDYYECHHQVMNCLGAYEGCLQALSATTNSPPTTGSGVTTDPTTTTTTEPCEDENASACRKANKKRCRNPTFREM